MKFALAKLGLWPFFWLVKENLHGGEVTITVASLFVPYHVEKYRLPPHIGDAAFSHMMSPIPFGTREWYHRLQLVARAYGVDYEHRFVELYDAVEHFLDQVEMGTFTDEIGHDLRTMSAYRALQVLAEREPSPLPLSRIVGK
jgi:hypothetical protein